MLDLVMKDEKRNSMLSMFWESKNDRVYRLEFQKKDAREEFVDYISKIRGWLNYLLFNKLSHQYIRKCQALTIFMASDQYLIIISRSVKKQRYPCSIALIISLVYDRLPHSSNIFLPFVLPLLQSHIRSHFFPSCFLR